MLTQIFYSNISHLQHNVLQVAPSLPFPLIKTPVRCGKERQGCPPVPQSLTRTFTLQGLLMTKWGDSIKKWSSVLVLTHTRNVTPNHFSVQSLGERCSPHRRAEMKITTDTTGTCSAGLSATGLSSAPSGGAATVLTRGLTGRKEAAGDANASCGLPLGPRCRPERDSGSTC